MQLPGFQVPNGGFFGSMTTDNGGMGGAAPGGAQGFTAPPIAQSILAMLAKMGEMGQQQGGGGPTRLPPNSFSPFMENGGQPQQQAQPGAQPGAAPGAGGPAAAGGMPGGGGLGGLNPEMLKQLLAKLGIGGPK